MTSFYKAVFAATLIILFQSFLFSQTYGATIEYDYDDLGRVITVTYSNGSTLVYTYDDAGNRLTADDDDTGNAFPIEFIVEGGVASEGDSITFTITKLGTATQTHAVDYDTFGDTATQGTDYTAATGNLSFTTSQTEKTVVVNTTEETIIEDLENFFFDLSNPTNGAIVAVSRAKGNILNDDFPNRPPVARIFNSGIPYNTATEICVTCGADPDGDEATITSVTGDTWVTATISGDLKKVVLTGTKENETGVVQYTIKDPSNETDSSVINVTIGCAEEPCDPPE